MSRKKLSVSELQWFAFVHAETDLEGLVEAYQSCRNTEQMSIYQDRLEQIRAYRLKRWGQTRFETETNGLTPADIKTIVAGPNRKFGDKP